MPASDKRPPSSNGAGVESASAGREGLLGAVSSIVRIPLYQSASALVLTTGANAGLGLVYWTLAARLFTTEEVGRGAASVAALQLVSMLGCTGLTPALIRFIPAGRAGTGRLVQGVYLAGLTLALVCGAGVLVSTQLFIEPLAVPGFVYLIAVAVWALFTLQDGALIGLRKEVWVPAENAFYGVTKIVMLVILSTAGAWAIFVSWSLSALLLVVPVNLVLFLKFIPAHGGTEPGTREEFSPNEIARFSAANHVSGLLMAAPDFLMPIIVLEMEGATENAFFYAAWSLVWPLRLVAVNVANAFTAHAAAAEDQARDLLLKAGLLLLALFVPLVLILSLGSNLLLRLLFGQDYAADGDVVMRLLAPGLLAHAFVALGVALARVRRQMGRLLALSALYAAVSLPLSIALISGIGIEGAGLAWLVAQFVLAGAALLLWSLRLLEGSTELTSRDAGSESIDRGAS